MSTEIDSVFLTQEDAVSYIENMKLKKPKKLSFSGTQYYRKGYYDMTWEKHVVS